MADGKTPLLLNLDETAVPLEFTHVRGNLIHRSGGQKIKDLPKQKASRSAVRCFFTHVAIICDDPALQPLLPQVLFFSSRHLSWQVWSELQASLPPNVFLRRQVSGWSNTEQHKVVLKILCLVLEPYLATRQPIIAFDAAPLHLQASVVELLGELNLWWVLVPKKETWLLQPLDTHAFCKYKRYIKARWLEKILARQGRRHVKDVVLIVVGAIRYVLQGNAWSAAFKANGLAGDLADVSEYIKKQLEWPVLPAIEATPPSEANLRKCWPATRRVPLREIFLSLGLEDPGPVDAPFGAAVEDSFVADPDADTVPLLAADDDDVPLVPEEPTLSDDDVPLVPPLC